MLEGINYILLVCACIDVCVVVNAINFYKNETLEYYDCRRRVWFIQGGKAYAIQEEAKAKRQKLKKILITANLIAVIWAIACFAYMFHIQQIISLPACIKSLIAFVELFVFVFCIEII